jgi:hypothetical protein
MPLLKGTYLTTRKANTIMASAFAPRPKDWLWPKVCGSYVTTSLTEPHAIGGAFPPLRRWRGSMTSTGIPSWTMEIPNPVHKTILDIDRSEMEGDQTRTILKYADQAGVALADYPEQLFSARILNGSLTASATDIFNGKSYNVTMDGLPFFSTTHQLDGVTNQSNIIQGSLPATYTALFAQDIATSAKQMQADVTQVIQKIKTVVNNQKIPIFPTLNSGASIVVMVPSGLEMIARMAFFARFIGGLNGTSGTSGSTDLESSYRMAVKDVLVSGYLDGLPDPENNGVPLAPTAQTVYYVFLVVDRVKPFYVQLFKPAGPNDLFPPGYNVERVVDELVRDAKAIGVEGIDRFSATLFASTIVEHNLDAVGSNAQRDVVEGEAMFISPRFRGQIAYGPWFCGWKVDPSGISG